MQHRKNDGNDTGSHHPAPALPQVVEQNAAKHRLFHERRKDTGHGIKSSQTPRSAAEFLHNRRARMRARNPDQKERDEAADGDEHESRKVTSNTRANFPQKAPTTSPAKSLSSLLNRRATQRGPYPHDRQNEQRQPIPLQTAGTDVSKPDTKADKQH